MDKPRLQYLKIITPIAPFFIIFVPSEPGDARREVVLASGFGCLSAVKSLLPADCHQFRLSLASETHPYRGWVQEYFSGNTKALSNISIELTDTPFQRRVWTHMRAIPHGTTISYAALARKMGKPKAARAVGSACKANRHMLLTPCHRVIKSDGTIGEYRFGSEIKRRLLELEQKTRNNK